jgi:hypothetical protein
MAVAAAGLCVSTPVAGLCVALESGVAKGPWRGASPPDLSVPCGTGLVLLFAGLWVLEAGVKVLKRHPPYHTDPLSRADAALVWTVFLVFFPLLAIQSLVLLVYSILAA